ncbi:uncharacterized protein CANTADRAFT_20281 [Suhomyces tanzawaensis NRRL Y-17324]|uniref:Uncharacterized protein n=1 Tax=Suhomyces tanzawaensis NRRL Y-17324 TaxID=984487 RepID=A0A1E4SMF3_9ASCO|nr:uncharacterized protein CANTADRAFT_20281 [Suhomyces tanzawaensis NRRL Y-17324]ODV80709.1 hypothetical protein CANTADRAFT_20281 [Suhomyces tanzawaensis NRRL Y-17324]
MNFIFDFPQEEFAPPTGPIGSGINSSSHTLDSTLSLNSTASARHTDTDDSILLWGDLDILELISKNATQFEPISHIQPSAPNEDYQLSSGFDLRHYIDSLEIPFNEEILSMQIDSQVLDETLAQNPEPTTDQEPLNPSTIVKGKLFNYSLEGTNPSDECFQLDLGTLNAQAISISVQNSVSQEFQLQDQYLRSIKRGDMEFLGDKVRKRRNPESDELVWKPVSIYQAAYTNIKIFPLEKTDYHLYIPQVSCFGKINMRVKRAWVRKPNNREKFPIYKYRGC